MAVTTLQTIVLVVAILVGLALIGYPVLRLFERLRSPICVPTVVIGLAILEVVAWYWFELGRRGLAWPMTVLLGLAVVFALVDVARRRGRIFRVDGRAARRAVASMVIGFVVVAFNWSAVLRLPSLTTASSGNNDAVSYAVSSEHLAQDGFGDRGPAVSYDLGAIGRIDAFGSIAMIGSVSAVSHLGSWRVTTSTLFALVILTTYGLAIFIDTLLGGDRWLLASVVAGAASCTLLFVYVQTFFFVGQVMGMAVVPLLPVAATCLAREGRRRQLAGPLLSATAVCLVMLSHYAHMLVLGGPLFVLPVALYRGNAERWRGVVRRALRTTFLMLASVAAALILVPVWYSTTLQYLRNKSNGDFGSALPGFTPPELLGFMRQVLPKPSVARVIWTVVTIVVIAALALVARGPYRRLVRYFTLFTILVALAYGAVYRREGGPSYRQWKFITFFQPTLVALVVAVGTVALEQVAATRTTRTRGIAVAVATGFAIVVSTNTGSGVGTALRDRRQIAYASSEQFDLSTDPMLVKISALNVNVYPGWDTMWAVYFLRDKTLYLESLSYYGVSAPQANWTLVPRIGSMRGPSVHDINALFRLLHEDPTGPQSDDASALDGTLSVTLTQDSPTPGTLTGTVSATNSGKARWLAQSAAIGGVGVGVHLEDDSGHIVEPGWARIPLIADRAFDLPPDSTTDAPFTLPTLPSGHYRLAFELVSEQVTWFGAPLVEDVVVP